MEFAEFLSVARLVVTVTAAIAAVVLGVSGGLIALIIRQSRVLGAIEERLKGANELFDRLFTRIERVEVASSWLGLALSEVRQEVEARCPQGLTPGGSGDSISGKGNGGKVVGPGSGLAG